MIKPSFSLPSQFKLSCIALSAIALVACGGGGGGSTPPTINSTVSGTAAKGIVKNGIVTIFRIADGVKGDVLVTGSTDVNGAYSLAVPGYSGPVIVEVTAGPDTQMICDLSAGCGTVAFGENFPLTDSFTLQAVQEVTVGETISTHINPLTSMAASLAIKMGVSSETVASSNAQVSTLFNLSGTLTDFAPVDISKPDLFAAASDEVKKLSLLSSALIAVGVESGQTISESLANLSDDFASNDGQLIQRQSVGTAVTTLEEIYEETGDILDRTEFTAKDFGQITATINTELAIAKLAPDNQLTAIIIRVPATGTPSELARAFVSDIRDLGVASTLDKHEAGISDFSDRFDVTAAVLSDDTGLVLEAFSDVVNAIAQGIEQNISGNYAVDGILVGDLGGGRYGFSGTHNGVAVNVSASGDYVELEGSRTASLQIVGSAANANINVIIREGSQANFEDSVVIPTEALHIDQVNLVLNARVEQLVVVDPASFEGALTIEGRHISQPEGSIGGDYSSFSLDTFDALNVLLSGRFAQAGESFSATLSVVADGENFTFDEYETTETADNFLDFSFSLSLSTQLTGISDNTLIIISGDRTAVDNGNVRLMVGFDGKRYTVDGTLLNDMANVTVRNQDNVVMTLLEGVDDIVTGGITAKGIDAATLTNEREAYIFRYIDGQFESL